jgi:hypothetical protein
VQVLQGLTKTKRDWTLHFGSEPPFVQGGTIPVWVRDEWSVTEAGVRDDAQRAGVGSPIVTVFLPKRAAGQLVEALAGVAAASETLDTRPVPTTEDGIQARGGIQTTRDTEQNRLAGIISQVLDDARVYQGGATEVNGPSPKEAIQNGLEASALRLFPKFDTADQTGWDKVVKRANDGAGSPLEALGYKGEVDGNQACSEILGWLGQPRTGNQIRSHFMAPPYGWPQDAIYGGLLALVADGRVKASYAGKARTPKELPHTQIGQTDFVRESQPLTATEKIELAALLKDTIGPVLPADAPGRVPTLLNTLAELSTVAGGDPPLPARPDTQLLTELQAHSGNVQARGVHQHREQLRVWFREWSEAKAKRVTREQHWQRLQVLLKQATGLSACEEIRTQAEAIRNNRSLLFDPDPVKPLISATADALRAALQDARNRHVEARKSMVEQLSSTAEWNQLNDAQWKYLLAKEGLGVLPPLEIGTDEHLLKALDERSLAVWEAEIAALPTRMQHAHESAVRLITPDAVKVTVKNATLTTGKEVDSYLDELRARIMDKIELGAPVLVQGA